MSQTTGMGLDTRARDALAILAHVYLQFDRPTEAAALLHALEWHDRDAGGATGADPQGLSQPGLSSHGLWAASARALALLLAGQDAEAVALAERLLDAPLQDAQRVNLLRILARACWRLGRAEEARAHHAAMQTLAAATIVPQQNGLSPR